MNLLYEHMIKAETDVFVCRIWAATSITSCYNVQVLARELLEKNIHTPMHAMKALVSMEGINSVEIINRADGCGMCVHKDWP